MKHEFSVITAAVLLMTGSIGGCGDASSSQGKAAEQSDLQPVSFRLPDRGSLIIIDVAWPESGACLNQFDVQLDEDDASISVKSVKRTVQPEQDCSDVATDGRTLSIAVPLATPVGNRRVLRTTGEPLPQRRLSS